jgi:putative transposase
MTQYRCASAPGATWFFTVNLAERNGNRLLVDEVDALRAAFRAVQAVHSFRIDAAVILPDHLHCIWTLPPGDSDFSTRWGLIKGNFSRPYSKGNDCHKAG